MIILNELLILIGIILMIIGILNSYKIIPFTKLIQEKHLSKVSNYIMGYRILMFFFLIGYITVFILNFSKNIYINQTVVSLIFMFGAVFVYLSISMILVLLKKLEATIHGIIPICSKCKKVRYNEEDPMDTNNWKRIEAYISEKSLANFSHGYCPECLNEEKEKIKHYKK